MWILWWKKWHGTSFRSFPPRNSEILRRYHSAGSPNPALSYWQKSLNMTHFSLDTTECGNILYVSERLHTSQELLRFTNVANESMYFYCILFVIFCSLSFHISLDFFNKLHTKNWTDYFLWRSEVYTRYRYIPKPQHIFCKWPKIGVTANCQENDDRCLSWPIIYVCVLPETLQYNAGCRWSNRKFVLRYNGIC
jgi:hypothetical protein